MRGRAALIRWAQQAPTKDDLVAVRALFERALEIDPKDADALVGSATTYLFEYSFGWTESRNRLRRENTRSGRSSHRARA